MEEEEEFQVVICGVSWAGGGPRGGGLGDEEEEKGGGGWEVPRGRNDVPGFFG